MKRHIINAFAYLLTAVLAVPSLVSCGDEELDINPASLQGEAAPVTVSVSVPSLRTRAGETLADSPLERQVEDVDIFFFDGNDYIGHLERRIPGSPVQTGEDGSFTVGSTELPKRSIDIWAVANAPVSLKGSFSDKISFLASVSAFADNRPGHLVMTGGKTVDIGSIEPDSEGVRHISGIVLERISNKLSLLTIAKDPESPLASADVRLKKAWVVMAPRSASYTAGYGTGSDIPPVPAGTAFSAATAEGLYFNTALSSAVSYGANTHRQLLTSPALDVEVTSAGTPVGLDLYFYPNPVSDVAATPSDNDYVTKLTLLVEIDSVPYYYVIGIQQGDVASACRDLWYKAGITLKREGNSPSDKDINDYLDWTKKSVDVSMSVLDWSEGTVISDYSKELDAPYNFAGTASAPFNVMVLDASGSVVETIPVSAATRADGDIEFRMLLPELTDGKRYNFKDQTRIRTITALPRRLRDGAGTLEQTFMGCTNLESICTFDGSDVTSYKQFFADCNNLVEVPWFDTSDATDFEAMFVRCRSIETVPYLNTSKGTSFIVMFRQCEKLLSVPSFDFSNTVDARFLFSDCTSLKYVPDLSFCGPDRKPGDLSSITGIFNYCPNLEYVGYIDLGDGRVRWTWRLDEGGMNAPVDASNFGSLFACKDSQKSDCPVFTDEYFRKVKYFGGILGADDCVNVSCLNSIDRESMLRVLNGLAYAGSVIPEDSGNTVTATTTKHWLLLHEKTWAKLTTDDIRIAIDKGWIVYKVYTEGTKTRRQQVTTGGWDGQGDPDAVFEEWTDSDGYHLRHLKTDGTSAHDTGLGLFDGTSYPDGFRLTATFHVADEDKAAKGYGTFITCMNEAGSPWQGFVLRHTDDTNPNMIAEVNPTGFSKTPAIQSDNTLEIVYNGSKLVMTLNGTVYESTVSVPTHEFPLTLGGAYRSYYPGTSTAYGSTASSGVWYSDRFAKVYVSALDVRPLSSGEDIDSFRQWTDGNVYHIENLVCDGTSATAYDTGLKLFDGVSYPNGFRLEADFSFPNGGTELAGQHSYISDKAEEMSGWPGFTLRHTAAAGSKMELTFKPVFAQNPVVSILPENHIVIEYDGQTANVTINGREYTGTGAVPVHDYPLTLGGTYNPVGTWIEDRFADVMIVSLTVSPLGEGGVFREWTDDEGYHLVNLTCDGTSSTAYNTGLKLYDSASYPNGFRLSADFTVDPSEISKNSQNTYLTCMSEAASPWPGFVVRHAQQASATGEIDVNTTGNLNAVTPALLSGSNHLEITYDGSVTTVRFNGATVNTLNGAVTAHSYPLVLGGSLDGTYNSSTTYSSMSALPWRRFSKVTFSSLLVEALDAVVNDLSVLPMSERMVRSEILRNPTAFFIHEQNGNKSLWNYQQGLELLSMLRVHEEYKDSKDMSYLLDYVDAFYDGDINANGTLVNNLYTATSTNYEVDRLLPGRCLGYLIDNTDTGDGKYRSCLDRFMNQLYNNETYTGQVHSRTAGTPKTADPGLFWHKHKYPSQLWIDGTYMYGPLRAEYASRYLTGQQQTDAFDDLAYQLLDAGRKLYDPVTRLYRHAWDESGASKWIDPDSASSTGVANQSYFAWLRGFGWFAMAVVDVLDYMPADHHLRTDVINLLKSICAGALEWQDSASGVWYTLPTEASDSRNYLEASGSSMMAYTFLKGYRKGYLDSSYLAAGKRAFEGILDEFVTSSDQGTNIGVVTLNGTVSVGGPGNDTTTDRDKVMSFYFSQPVKSNNAHGVGPFIMASVEYEKTV